MCYLLSSSMFPVVYNISPLHRWGNWGSATCARWQMYENVKPEFTPKPLIPIAIYSHLTCLFWFLGVEEQGAWTQEQHELSGLWWFNERLFCVPCSASFIAFGLSDIFTSQNVPSHFIDWEMAIQRGCTFLSRSQDWNQRNNTDSRDVWHPKPTLLLGVECFRKHKEYFFFLSFFFAVPSSKQDPSFPTRYWTHVPCSGRVES